MVASHFFQSVGGRTLDHHITINSGILDYVDPNDQWMADRGFLVRGKFCNVVSKYMWKGPCKNKVFRYLKSQILLTHLPILDGVLTIVGALCNLQEPFVK